MSPEATAILEALAEESPAMRDVVILAEGDRVWSASPRGPLAWFRDMATREGEERRWRDYGQHVHGAILIAGCLGQPTFRFVGRRWERVGE